MKKTVLLLLITSTSIFSASAETLTAQDKENLTLWQQEVVVGAPQEFKVYMHTASRLEIEEAQLIKELVELVILDPLIKEDDIKEDIIALYMRNSMAGSLLKMYETPEVIERRKAFILPVIDIRVKILDALDAAANRALEVLCSQDTHAEKSERLREARSALAEAIQADSFFMQLFA